jgi:hypothetical protein
VGVAVGVGAGAGELMEETIGVGLGAGLSAAAPITCDPHPAATKAITTLVNTVIDNFWE